MKGTDVAERRAGGKAIDVSLQSIVAVQGPQRVQRKMLDQRCDRAVAQQLPLQPLPIGVGGDYMTAGENVSGGMDDESASRASRAGLQTAIGARHFHRRDGEALLAQNPFELADRLTGI